METAVLGRIGKSGLGKVKIVEALPEQGRDIASVKITLAKPNNVAMGKRRKLNMSTKGIAVFGTTGESGQNLVKHVEAQAKIDKELAFVDW